ncbi:restriction endonuclease [bacterium]|nr:restriction endonuclease [bacterium]|tara:strand:- start:4272 stop:5846 length:1575 start_codon:yes stop_codon:yes gene_type:complete
MTTKGTKRKPTFKQMAFETAVRNPERYMGIIAAVKKYEGVVLDDDNLLDIVSNLYLTGEVTSEKISISENTKIGDIVEDVKKTNATRRADGGFPEGYASRFWTYMRTLSELGFVYAQYNKSFKISDIGRKLIEGEIDEQEAFSIQAMKFNRQSPYRNVSNDYNFFRLALEVLICLKKKGSKLSYEQFVVLMFNQSGNSKETLDILEENTFSDEGDVHKFVSEHYGSKLKVNTVTRDYPDVVRRLMVISGFVTIRYAGKKFIEINENKLNYINAMLSLEFILKDEEKADPKAYFDKLDSQNEQYLELVHKYRNEDAIDGDEYRNKIHQIISIYEITEEKILESIKAIGDPRNEVIPEFKEIPAPLKLEFYISILIALRYKDRFSIRPNYKADHIGKPYSHAPGNYGDIDVYSDDIYWLIEVTLIRNKAQQMNNETTSVIRHLDADEEFKYYSSKYLSFIAPTIHDDTRSFFDVAVVQSQVAKQKIHIKPYTVQSFVQVTQAEENLQDMEEYTKLVFDKFRDQIAN